MARPPYAVYREVIYTEYSYSKCCPRSEYMEVKTTISIKILLKRLRGGLITRILHFSIMLSLDADQHRCDYCHAVTPLCCGHIYTKAGHSLYLVVQVDTLQEKRGYLLLPSYPNGYYNYQKVSHSKPLPSAHNMLI